MRYFALLLLLLVSSATAAAAESTVFLEGEVVLVRGPESHDGGAWQALDERLNEVASGAWSAGGETIALGRLPVGWYRVVFLDEAGEEIGFTTTAVLAALAEAPPADSPVAVDVALSWVPAREAEVWECVVRLARLAGIAMVRDRLRWREIQPERDAPLLEDTVYEQTADLQQAAGLHVLQVFHDSPPWAWAHPGGRGRIPADLRDTWQFARKAASRFQGRVQAWQPWNEGNVRNFGAHTMDELCSHQKAAYWGFRAGDPEALVCWAPMAGVHTEGHYRAITANGVAPYFDVFTFHSYDWAHSYAELRLWAMRAASGKPVWVTESDRGMTADPDSPVGDLPHAMERLKAKFVTQSIVSSLATGAVRHFHFILPQYMEQNNTVQFGLLRHDKTPRMGYATLAAAGRFLAGAEYLGRAGEAAEGDVYLFAFRARPDGVDRDVLVAWTEAPVDWPHRGGAAAALALETAVEPVGVWDYMGRPLGAALPAELTSAPLFIVFAAGETASWELQPLPEPEPLPEEAPSPVVLQLYAPEMPLRERTQNWSYEYDRTVNAGENRLTIAAYHFGEETVAGRVGVATLPAGWQVEPAEWEMTLEPLQRHDQAIVLHIPEPGPGAPDGAWLHFEGRFGPAGKPRLAFRVMPEEE